MLARSDVLVGGLGSSVEATEVDAVDATTTNRKSTKTDLVSVLAVYQQ